MRTSVALFFVLTRLLATEHYRAVPMTDHGVDVVRLSDTAHDVQVSIVPSMGNRAYELKVHGTNVLYSPFPDVGALKSSAMPGLNGIPFLAPWANRLAGAAFWADGRRYLLNPDLGSVHVSAQGISIHGMLSASRLWKVIEMGADKDSAYVTSRLQFWKEPELMANWPFAHEYEMTYRLANGVLQVTTRLTNLSSEAMPVSLGFHPYFRIPQTPRAEQSIHIAARQHVETDSQLVATGALIPNELPAEVSLKDHTFDDGYTDLVRDAEGHATFWVQAGQRKIEVIYGPKYQVAVIYAPPGQEFVCFEPMAAITNGINLAHDGKYPELQSVAPGGVWSESFFVKVSGF